MNFSYRLLTIVDYIYLIIIFTILFFLILEIMARCWRIDQNIDLLKKITDLLKSHGITDETGGSLPNNKDDSSIDNPQMLRKPEYPKIPCAYCRQMTSFEKIESYNGNYICPDCLSKIQK